MPTVPSRAGNSSRKCGDTLAPSWIEPFRARLAPSSHLVFHRKVWAGRDLKVQGFVVALPVFYDWLMQQSFDNTGLADFEQAILAHGETAIAIHPVTNAAYDAPHDAPTASKSALFRRTLGYPLERFTWRVDYDALPALPTRNWLIGLAAGVALLLAAGLMFLYRTAAEQVALAQKRQDFVSAVTHELKTPLTSIRLSAEMLKEGWVGDDDKRREYYATIANQGERLSRLINNVLQLARLEKGTARYDIVSAQPNRIFNGIAREMETLVLAQGFAWRVEEEPDMPAVRYDTDVLQQVCFTLLDNSLKFSSKAAVKEITFALKRLGAQVVLEIADRGPGIPASELTRVFETFYRVESELTRKTIGTGIGLAMAKMMVEGMGGEIKASSREDGPGLIVRIGLAAV